MKTTDFSDYKEHPLTWEEDAEALSYIEMMKDALVAHGFLQAAVDAIEFDVRAHTLNLTEDEKKSGKWHRYDGGKPYFEISVSCDATLEALESNKLRFDPRDLSAQAQAAFLLIDLAANCFAKVEKLSSHFGSACANDNMATDSGFTLDVSGGLSTHLTTQRELDVFFGKALDVLESNLCTSKPKPALPKLVSRKSDLHP